jgi:hypothetical protein
MVVVEQERPQPTALAGIAHATLASGAEGLTQLSVPRQSLAPGAATPPHSHDCDEAILCRGGPGRCSSTVLPTGSAPSRPSRCPRGGCTGSETPVPDRWRSSACSRPRPYAPDSPTVRRSRSRGAVAKMLENRLNEEISRLCPLRYPPESGTRESRSSGGSSLRNCRNSPVSRSRAIPRGRSGPTGPRPLLLGPTGPRPRPSLRSSLRCSGLLDGGAAAPPPHALRYGTARPGHAPEVAAMLRHARQSA